MLKKITKLLTVTAIISGILGYANYSHSNAAGAPKGACSVPGEKNCGSAACHGHDSTKVALNSSNVKVVFTRYNTKEKPNITSYVSDCTYIVNVSLRRAAATNGFESVIVDKNLYGVGTTGFYGPNALGVQFVTGTSSKSYATQCGGAGVCYVGTDGSKLSSWQYKWTAPHSTQGTLIIYTCALKGGASKPFGDSTFCRVDSLQYGTLGTQDAVFDKNISAFMYENNLHIGYIFDNAKEISFDVFDIYGNRIYSIPKITSSNGNHNINVSGWPKGMYVIRGMVGQETWAKKIVIQ